MTMTIQIRRYEPRDMPRILEIESQSFDHPWDIREFLNLENSLNNVIRVIEVQRTVIGYVVYELLTDSFVVKNIAVAPEWRRRGVGTQLIEDLKGRLAFARRREVSLEVRESNLSAQCFLRSCGFKCFMTLPGQFKGYSDEDAYLFRHSIMSAGANRVGGFYAKRS